MLPCQPQVVRVLHCQPAFRRPTDGFGQAKRHLRGDAAATLENPAERRRRHIELECQFPAADPVGFEIDVGDEFAGVGRVVHCHQ